MKDKFNAIQDLLDGEFEERDIKWDIEDHREEGGYHYFDIEIVNSEEKNLNSDLRFRIENNKIEIEMGEGNWEDVASYNNTIKNLWIVLCWI